MNIALLLRWLLLYVIGTELKLTEKWTEADWEKLQTLVAISLAICIGVGVIVAIAAALSIAVIGVLGATVDTAM